MNEEWASLPASTVLVCATVLTGAPAIAATPSRERGTQVAVLSATASEAHLSPNKAPTCGPCCHGSPSCDDGMLSPKKLVEREPDRPVEEKKAEPDPVADPPPDEAVETAESPDGTGDTITDDETNSDETNPDETNPDEDDVDPMLYTAPTCGPCCHGSEMDCGDMEVSPPPLETPKGCSVAAPAGDAPNALMLLGLGLLGLGRRRHDRRS